MINFGDWLRDELKRQHITQAKFAEMASTDDRCVSLWIRGVRDPRLYKLDEVLNVLGYHMEFVRNEDKQ